VLGKSFNITADEGVTYFRTSVPVQWLRNTSTNAGLLVNFRTGVIMTMASKERSKFRCKRLDPVARLQLTWGSMGLGIGWHPLCISFRVIQDEDF